MNADEEKQKKAISLDEDLVIKLSILAVRKNKTKSEVIREALSKSN
ncbi:ribbon-helix-helix protein, CopG family, partial [Salmonella enterica]|nr:ribbon-helix-helix protein, CopG family [Salmonella enterica]EHP4419410.1 ribbon-helix-helix protein, CopG family [Salmonella enterica]